MHEFSLADSMLQMILKQMEHSTQPLRFGTLVVFTDGTDHAHRVTREDMVKQLP